MPFHRAKDQGHPHRPSDPVITDDERFSQVGQIDSTADLRVWCVGHLALGPAAGFRMRGVCRRFGWLTPWVAQPAQLYLRGGLGPEAWVAFLVVVLR